jgi:AraC-like DNA-binding protein
LGHSTLDARLVGDRLGFDEARGFVKFFRPETGLTPGGFRQQQERWLQRLNPAPDVEAGRILLGPGGSR